MTTRKDLPEQAEEEPPIRVAAVKANGAVSFPQESAPYEQARLRLGRALAEKLGGTDR
jgi:hypothetical protein